ncbi:MAG TPA: hypothetical protein VF175_04360 [Lacipirellula sp.]
MMRVALLISMLLGSGTIPGCGQKTSDAPPKVAAGVVDESLPPEVRERQDALIRAFRVIKNGTDVKHVSRYEADLQFNESAESFYGEGVALARWDWAGPPAEDKLPVRLEMTLDEPPGDKTVPYERTYQVRKTGDGFVITPVDN